MRGTSGLILRLLGEVEVLIWFQFPCHCEGRTHFPARSNLLDDHEIAHLHSHLLLMQVQVSPSFDFAEERSAQDDSQ